LRGSFSKCGAAADRDGRAVGLGDELLAGEAVVAKGSADLEGAGAVDQPVDVLGEGLELSGGDVLGGDPLAGGLRFAREGDPVGAGGVVEGERRADEGASPHRHEGLAVRTKDQLRPLDPEALQCLREVRGERLLEGAVAGAVAPDGVPDADGLVVAHVADGPLVLVQGAEAQVRAHLEVSWVRREGSGGRLAVARVGVRLPDEGDDVALRDQRGVPSRGDAAVDEDDRPVEGDLDADEGVLVAGDGELDDAVGNGVGEAVRVPLAHGLGESQLLGHGFLLPSPLASSGGSSWIRAARGSTSFRQPSGVRRTRISRPFFSAARTRSLGASPT
jgi:hypothetical protein